MSLVSSPDTLILRILWKSFDLLAQYSQSIIETIGPFARFEAIRTEKNQYRGKPLVRYQDINRISEYSQSWKQILAFFVRTQDDLDLIGTSGPIYQFNQYQKRYFDRLYRLLSRFDSWKDFENSIPLYQKSLHDQINSDQNNTSDNDSDNSISES